MKTIKSPASISDQLAKLEERGCIIENKDEAAQTLRYINYFRLAHYFEPFLETKNHYREGTSFDKIIRIYDFDRRLRTLILSMLEEIEIALRAAVSNYHAAKYGTLGYMNASTFDRSHNHIAFQSKIQRMIESNEDKAFVRHHIKKYSGAFPVWAIMELFSFGSLIYFYIDMHGGDKREIAKNFYRNSPSYLEDWFLCMSDLRNHCAHYNRLYANVFENTPKTPPESEYIFGNTLFDYLLTAKLLYNREKRWDGGFLSQLAGLVDEYSDCVDMSMLGFPDCWIDRL